MKMRYIRSALLLAAMSGAMASNAQVPGLPGGASKAMGMPDVSSMLPDNAAGVLDYCVKNKLLGGTEATSVLDGIKGKPEITGSSDFATGAAGILMTDKPAAAGQPSASMMPGASGGKKSSYSLESLPEPLRSKICDTALSQAKSLL